jgi:hypothetical protein
MERGDSCTEARPIDIIGRQGSRELYRSYYFDPQRHSHMQEKRRENNNINNQQSTHPP